MSAASGSPFDSKSPAVLDEAVMTWQQGQEEDALALFERALRAAPDDLRTLLFAAKSFGARFYIDRARELLDRAVALAPDNSRIHLNVGKVFQDIELPTDATIHYKRACELPDTQPMAQILLATQCERMHQLDDAATLIERALAAAPGDPQGLLVQARIQRRQGDTTAARQSLQDIVDTAPSGSDPFCEAWAEIAGLCDKDGDYDGAIAAIEKCKSVQMETADREWSQAQQAYARYHQFLQEVNVGHFAAWRARAESLEVERVGVLAGFPRTGTTLLEQMLDAHPDLYSV
ncbi:MAG: tetratricopeptide repeat protein, partial [Pseudomonadota bacterium]